MRITIPRAVQDYLHKIKRTEYYLVGNKGIYCSLTYIYKKRNFWFDKKIGSIYEDEIISSDEDFLRLLDACTDYKTKFNTKLVL